MLFQKKGLPQTPFCICSNPFLLIKWEFFDTLETIQRSSIGVCIDVNVLTLNSTR